MQPQLGLGTLGIHLELFIPLEKKMYMHLECNYVCNIVGVDRLVDTRIQCNEPARHQLGVFPLQYPALEIMTRLAAHCTHVRSPKSESVPTSSALVP